MTFTSAIRFAAPLLLAVTLAGCVRPYDDNPYYGANTYSFTYYGGLSHYGRPYHGGRVYAVDPSRRHRTDRTHRRDRRDRDGDFRHRRRAHERSDLEEGRRRGRAERLREWRRAAADRAGSPTGDRSADRRRRERAAERPAAERRAWRAERQAQERGLAPRRYDEDRDADDTDAAFTRRVERAEREDERESPPLRRLPRGGARTQR